MATLLLSIVIFGSASWIIYHQLKSGNSCEDCQTSCPVKHEQVK